MLQIELLLHTETEKAATIFHRDGFVAIKDALTPDQLKLAQSGAPFEVTIGQVEAIVEGAELAVVFFVDFGLPGLGVFVAEIEAAAEGAGVARGA